MSHSNSKSTLSDEEIRKAIADSLTSAAAIKSVMRLVKERDPKKTLGFLAKAARIPSTGYLADVASGRRRLQDKHRQALLEALGIFGVAADLIAAMINIENTKAGSPDLKTAVLKCEALRKLLRQQNRTLPERLSGMFFAFEVFAAFGLNGQKSTRDSLRKYFGVARGVEIDRALSLLVQSGLIEKHGPGFRVISDQINFIGGDDGMSHLDYLSMAMRDAEARMSHWFAKKDESFFLSSILSVKDSEFRGDLPRIKDLIRRQECDLESGEADRLVRFNVQIYPLR